MASCPAGNFTSITGILSQADAGNLNVTQLVQSCSQICSLAWGNGNPDLSGIGANISYILQFILIVVFGPIFTLVYGLRKKLELREKLVDDIVSLQEGFVDVSAQFTIPVAVAAIVRLRQDAPFFEVTFLQSLMSMQFFGLLAVIVATGVVDPFRKPTRIVLLILYGLLNFAFYMGLVGHLRTSKASFDTIRELAQACQGYGPILPGFLDAQTKLAHVNKTSFTHGLLSRGGWIIFGLTTAGMAAVGVLVLFVMFFGKALDTHNAYAFGIMSLGLTAGALYETVEMEIKRNIIKDLSGASFEDNEWGFGQVVSLFLWVPLFLQAVYYVGRRIFEHYFPEFFEKHANEEGLHSCPCTCACAVPHPIHGSVLETAGPLDEIPPPPGVLEDEKDASDETPSPSADPGKETEAPTSTDVFPSL